MCVCVSVRGLQVQQEKMDLKERMGQRSINNQTFFFHSFPFLDIFILSKCTFIGLVVLLLLLQGEQGDHGAMGEPGERSEVGDPGPPGPPGDAGVKGFPVSA